jgi:hypothetical protein
MNWIERRAKRESNLKDGVPRIWEEVKTALADACESYNKLYGAGGATSVVSESTAEQFIASLAKTGKTIFINLAQNSKGTGITVKPEEESAPPRTFAIRSDEDSVFIVTGDKQIGADELSQLILEPLLFPKG